MAGGASALKRGLFGYSKRSVLETLIDRDVMFGRAQQRLKAAEEELARTRAAVEAVRTELGERTRQADEDRARLETELEDARGRLGESRREVDARTEEVRAATARAGEMEVEVHRLTEELRLQQERPTAGEGEGERAFSSEELAGVVANAEQALASVFERDRPG
jgi:chromosome segregation ATPase